MKYCKTTTVTPRPRCRDDKIREGCTARAGCSRCSRAPRAPQTHRAVLHYGARVRLRAPRFEKSRTLTPPVSCVSVAAVHRRDSAPHTPTRSAAAPCSLVRRGARPKVGAGARCAALQRAPGCSHHMCAQFAAAPPHARRAGELTHLYIVRDHKVRPDGAPGRTPKVRA
jgi:hypothetical protein